MNFTVTVAIVGKAVHREVVAEGMSNATTCNNLLTIFIRPPHSRQTQTDRQTFLCIRSSQKGTASVTLQTKLADIVACDMEYFRHNILPHMAKASPL